MWQRSTLWLTLFLVVAGCSNSDSPADPIPVDGTWSYATSVLTAPGFDGSCTLDPTSYILTQTGDSIEGIRQQQTGLTCTPTGGDPEVNFIAPAGGKLEGKVTGSKLVFDIGGPFWHHTGRYSAQAMSGSLHLSATIGMNGYILEGTFQGQKQ